MIVRTGPLIGFLIFAFLFLLAVLWPWRVFVAIGLAAVVFVMVGVWVVGQVNEVTLRNKRYHHEEETPLQQTQAAPKTGGYYQSYQQQQ